MLHLSGPAQGEGFTLRQEVFESLREMSEERESEGLERMLDAAAVNGRARAAFVRSLASPVSGQVVVVRPRNGEIGEGRRAWIFGQGGEAWVARRPQADSEVVDIQPVDDANLGALLSSWLEDLAG
jgi:hypothetical protein